MVNKTQEALKMAIKAMKDLDEGHPICTSDLLQVCKEALAELEQVEPFGYFKAEPFGWTDCADTDEGAIALYENPPSKREWRGLNNDIIREIGEKCQEKNRGILNWIDFYNGIEGMLKDKNYG